MDEQRVGEGSLLQDPGVLLNPPECLVNRLGHYLHPEERLHEPDLLLVPGDHLEVKVADGLAGAAAKVHPRIEPHRVEGLPEMVVVDAVADEDRARIERGFAVV